MLTKVERRKSIVQTENWPIFLGRFFFVDQQCWLTKTSRSPVMFNTYICALLERLCIGFDESL